MFPRVVNLFRLAGRPKISDGTFSYEGLCSPELADSIVECRALAHFYGGLIEDYLEGDHCSFTFKLPSNEHGKFYENISSFLNAGSSVNKGEFPSNFYIVDIDWVDSDNEEPVVITNLRSVCRLVHLLTFLAVGVDRETNRSFFNLFFALPQDGIKPPRSFLVATKVSAEMLEYKLRHLELLAQILDPKNAGKPNQAERLMMFSLSVADVLDSHEGGADSLLVIVREWDAILSQYRINLQSYVYGFSFERVRQEVARAELEYAKSLSSILGDIAGKLLALPVSFAGLVILNNSSNLLEVWVVSLGLLVASCVLLSIIKNQEIQVERLKHSFDMVFEGFESRKDTYPKKIQSLLAQTVEQLNRQVNKLERTFSLLVKLSLVPVWGVVIICIFKLFMYFLGF